MTLSAPPTGVIVPLVTPLLPTGRVDTIALRRVASRCVRARADAVFVGGSAGMGPMLLPDQWEEALAITLDEIGDRALVLCGIIETSTQRALRQIATSQRLGCRAIVVTPTFYINLVRPSEMLAHFGGCRDATDQEMVIYNIPSCTHSSIPPAVVRECAERGWTRCMKESSGDRAYFSEVLKAVEGLDVAVLQGNEPDIAWGLQQGAAGIVPVCANVEPETFVAAVAAARTGDWAKLAALQQRIDIVRDTVLIGDHNWISGLFAALNVLGLTDSQPLLPLQPVGEERIARLQTFLNPGPQA